MIVSDDDDDDSTATQVCVSCDCAADHHSSFRCAGCNVCYFKSLDLFNSEQTDRGRKISPEYHDSDEILDVDFGSKRWFCPKCDKKFLSNGQICIDTFLECSTQTRGNNDDFIGEERNMENDLEKSKLVQLDAPGWFKTFQSGLQDQIKLLNEKIDNEMKSALNANDSHEDICLHEFHSPPRKLRRGTAQTFANIVGESAPATANASATMLQPPAQIDSSNQIKMKIKKGANMTASNLLKSLHEVKPLLPEFTGKKHSDDSIDVLFRNFEEANKAKTILENKLEGAIINDPAPAKMKRFNLVGFQLELNAEEVVDAIVTENKYWLDLEKSTKNVLTVRNDPSSCIIVHRVRQCKDNETLSAIVSISPNMLATLGQRKLCIGYVKCKLYEWKSHDRCYNCQEVGHYASSCKNDIACSKCAGKHHSKNCNSVELKCVNCLKNSKNECNHASYSPECPYNAVAA